MRRAKKSRDAIFGTTACFMTCLVTGNTAAGNKNGVGCSRVWNPKVPSDCERKVALSFQGLGSMERGSKTRAFGMRVDFMLHVA